MRLIVPFPAGPAEWHHRRMMGLDAPEKRASSLPRHALPVPPPSGLVQLRVWLERHCRDRDERTLAIVHDRAGRDLAQVMIREGLARPYNGRGQLFVIPGESPAQQVRAERLRRMRNRIERNRFAVRAEQAPV